MDRLIFLLPTLCFAVLNSLSVSVWQKWKFLEYIAKPATLICLIAWFHSQAGFTGPTLWFGVGLFLSLLGDVLLLDRIDQFLGGLVAFLLAHLFYIIVFTQGTLTSRLYPLFLALFVSIFLERLLRRILSGLEEKGKNKLRLPVLVYGLVISFMLLFALTTFFREGWKTAAAALISLGAALFLTSDVSLSWNKFVQPIRNGRVINMVAYHLGQILLTAGVLVQFVW